MTKINPRLQATTILRVGLSAAVAVANILPYEELDNLTLLNSYNNNDNDISVEGGKIKINGNIKAIKISGVFGFYANPGAIYMWPKKNGVNVGAWQVQTTSNTYNSFSILQLLPASQGDVISFSFYTDSPTTLEVGKTGFFVEAIR